MSRRVLLLAIGWLLASCKKPAPPPTPEEELAPPPTAAAATPKAETAHRCAPVSADPPFVLGPADTGRAAKIAPAGSEPGQDDSLPFAAEVGEGVAYSDGFAVGAIHESEASHSMSVVTLDRTGHGGKVIPLGTAHGDVEPPRVAARGATLLAGMLSPGINGRSLRLAKIEAGAVTWGATILQKSDESQAFDIGLGEKKGIAVWDEDGASSGVIQVSTFDSGNASNATTPRTISPPGVDAESPRLAARPGGGYWLAYIAQRAGGDSSDAGYEAEPVGFRWIEVLALDAQGSPTGAARAATSRDAHVMVFDMAPLDEGHALVVWRDNDTPLESAAGPVMRTVVRAANIEQPSVLVASESGGGAPTLLPGWAAVTDAADMTRLAPVGRAGEIAGSWSTEPDIGSGEPIAVGPEGVLVARPAGRAVKLAVLRCTREAAPASPSPAQ
ncbi:MAG TPA: hypothetical protein VK550_35640 [Polyangiaceae bacterium]|nr:hypothetical protein [Polyangiaceae bacterium]